MGLKEQIAEKMGITTTELTAAIYGDIQSTTVILFIIAIVLLLSTVLQHPSRVLFALDFKKFRDYHKINKYYIVIGGIIGFVMLLLAIRRAVMFDAIVLNRLFEMAQALGISI